MHDTWDKYYQKPPFKLKLERVPLDSGNNKLEGYLEHIKKKKKTWSLKIPKPKPNITKEERRVLNDLAVQKH